MRWSSLAFLHWPVRPALLRHTLPPGLELDTYDGSAWLGVVPFAMRATRFDWAPSVPTATDFLELNLRTYVRAGDRVGVWFYSLDASSALAVRGARLGFALPYFDARMEMEHAADGIGVARYRAERVHRGAPVARFEGAYGPSGPPRPAAPGTLEHFLTERYCLFAQRGFGVRVSLRGGLQRGDVDHEPWPLQPAVCDLRTNDMFRLVGDVVAPADRLRPPVVHFAADIPVRAWAPVRERVAAALVATSAAT